MFTEELTVFNDFVEGRCDKCNKIVPKNNSCLLLLFYAEGLTPFTWDRHLHPTDSCEGSPSRVRHIEENEDWKEAYTFIQSQIEKGE